jgi:hypothetical protein
MLKMRLIQCSSNGLILAIFKNFLVGEGRRGAIQPAKMAPKKAAVALLKTLQYDSLNIQLL